MHKIVTLTLKITVNQKQPNKKQHVYTQQRITDETRIVNVGDLSPILGTVWAQQIIWFFFFFSDPTQYENFLVIFWDFLKFGDFLKNFGSFCILTCFSIWKELMHVCYKCKSTTSRLRKEKVIPFPYGIKIWDFLGIILWADFSKNWGFLATKGWQPWMRQKNQISYTFFFL